MRNILLFLCILLITSSCGGKKSQPIVSETKDTIDQKSMLIDSLIRNGEDMVAIGNIKFGISKKQFKIEAKKFLNSIKDDQSVPRIGLWELSPFDDDFANWIGDINESEHESLIYRSYFINDSLCSVLIKGQTVPLRLGTSRNTNNEEIYKPLGSLSEILSYKYGEPDESQWDITFKDLRFGELRTIAKWNIGEKSIRLIVVKWAGSGGDRSCPEINMMLQIINNSIYDRGIEIIEIKERSIKESLQKEEQERVRKSEERFKSL